jgi:cytoskeletal protein CcmA (bactofilin family)
MAWEWFGRGKQEIAEWTGFLEQGVRLEGRLELPGTFRINGLAKAHLVSQQVLILGDKARVEGQIDGNVVIIEGRFDGVITARTRVEVQPKGVVTGEIHTPCLIIEPGAIFDGQCHMIADEDAAQPITIPIRSSASQAS